MSEIIDLSTKTTEGKNMEHREVATYQHGAKCTCGFFSMGTAEDPALFSDHLMAVSRDAGII